MSRYIQNTGIKLTFVGVSLLVLYIAMQSAVPFLSWVGGSCIFFGLVMFTFGKALSYAEN